MMPVGVIPTGGKAAPVIIIAVLGVLAFAALTNRPAQPSQSAQK
ncbi:MAG: hypothetical protein PHF20_09295 [Halothiobacillaceae bacterium]|nr:hypothetical protein [Halothiobacillaceae bacterium]